MRHLRPVAADVDAAIRRLLPDADEAAVRELVAAVCDVVAAHPHCTVPSAADVVTQYGKVDRDARIVRLRRSMSVAAIAKRTGLSPRQVRRIADTRPPLA